MNASSRFKIVVPLVSVVAMFALSAHAEDQPKGNGKPPGASGKTKGADAQGGGRDPQGGSRASAGRRAGRGDRARVTRAAHCRRAISAGTPIAAISPGRADAGITRCTTAATAGGGTSEASGITTRKRWTGRPPISPRIMPMTFPMAPRRPLARNMHHRLQAPTPPPPPPPDPAASAVGGAVVGGLLGGLLTGRASGAAAGAVIGGATGAIAGATAASQPGYYWAQGSCYYRYPSGQYVQADPRACY